MKSCAYGQVNRQMILETGNDIKEIKESLKKIDEKILDLFNHQSNRLPLWATIMITLLSSLVVGLVVTILKGG